MTKLKKYLLEGVTILFILLEAVLFYLIHIQKVNLGYSLHYGAIIAAAAYSWLTLGISLLPPKEMGEVRDLLLNAKNGNLIRIAMLFTLTADYFLVAIDRPTHEDHIAGVAFFLGTQLFIYLHIAANEKNSRVQYIHLGVRFVISLMLIVITGLVLGRDTDALAMMSTVYYANLVVNAIFAHRSGKGGIMLTVGLIFFALCDINVGLSALNNIYDGGFPEGSLLYNLLYSGVDLVWIFYLPSQTIIPLTLMLCNKNEKIKKQPE